MSLSLKFKQRLVQTISLVLLNSNVRGAETYGFCLPIMHCNACPLSWTLCPVYKLSELLQFHEPLISLEWLIIAAIFALCALVGRFFCGWVCPAGFVQDLLYKTPSPKFNIPVSMQWLKYGFLCITVVGVAYFLGKEVPVFFCSYCPTAAIESVIPAMLFSPGYELGAAGYWRFPALVLVLVLVVTSERSFCKIMCPIGAMVAITNKFSLFSMKLSADKCIHCHKCDKSCPMDVPVENCSNTGKKINRNLECVECLTCESVCPATAITNNSKVLHK